MSKFRFLLATGLAVLFLTVFVWSQAETGQIAGTVLDPSGAIVPNAPVTLTNVNTGSARTAQTSQTGLFTFTNLQPGVYEVNINAPGFAQYKERVQVTVGSVNTVSPKLAVAAAAGTTVEVVAEGGVEVETRNQDVSTLVPETQIKQLPTLTRNPYDLVALSGFTSSMSGKLGSPSDNVSNGFDRGVGMNINGQRSASTNILIDGGENVDLFDATPGQSVPQDSIQEFRIVTSDFSAQYGRASGGIVNVATKAGTNAFHGTAYEFYRGAALTSNSYDNNATDSDPLTPGHQPVPKPNFVRNQFGYSVGGPIVKNKVFFFQSTEWTRVRSSSNQIILVPTPEFIAAASPLTQQFMNAFPLQTPINGSIITKDRVVQDFEDIDPAGPFAALPAGFPVFGETIFSVPADAGGGSPQNSWSQVARVDLNINENNSLFGRYSYERENFFEGSNAFSPYAGFNTGAETRNHNGLLSFTHIFGPSLVSQSKAIFNRLFEIQPLGSQPAGPTLYFSGAGSTSVAGRDIALPGYLPFNPGSAIPFGGPQNLYQFYEDLTWTKGNHQFRFGGEYIHTRDNRVFGAFENAVEELSLTSTPGLDRFLNGTLERFQTAVDPQGKFPCVTDPVLGPIETPECSVTLPASQPRFGRNNRYNDGAAYIMDTWRLFPNFTLNLGLRWEYFGVQHNVDQSLDSNFFYGQGSNRFEQIRNGFVATSPNSPVEGLWGSDWNNFAPRVGFAWDITGDGRTSLRGGYGISYERNFGNVTFNTIQNPPNYAVLAIQSGVDVAGDIPVTQSNLGPLGGASGLVPLPRTSLRHLDQNLRTAYANFWSLTLEREVARNTVASIAYSGSHGVKLYSIENPTKAASGNVYLGDPVELGPTRLNFQYSNLNTRANNGFSNYNGLNLGLRSSNVADLGLSLTANYTWSHAIDNLSSTFSDNNFFNLGLLDPFNPALDKGSADFDTRHRLVIGALYDVGGTRRWGKGWLDQIVGGWSVGPILEIRSGLPFTVYDSTNANSIVPRFIPGGPVQFAPNRDATGIADSTNLFNYLDLPAAVPYVNPIASAAFGFTPEEIAAGQGISDFGPFPANMTRRNAFKGPGAWNLNFAVHKAFKLTEQVGLQFRGEFFNAFNHSNLYIVPSTTDIAQTNFIQAKKGVPPASPTQSNENRNIQLGVKLTF